MSRLPFNVLIVPFRLRAGALEYAVLHRSDGDKWQFIAGGGEGAEDPVATARREAQEEGGLAPNAEWIKLDSTASIPRSFFSGEHWPQDLYVIPEHAFAVRVEGDDLRLCSEHDSHEWLDYEAAFARLSWDSNRVALWELRERLKR